MGQGSSSTNDSLNDGVGRYNQPSPQSQIEAQPKAASATAHAPVKPTPVFVRSQQRVITDALAATVLESLPAAYQSYGKTVQWLQLYNSSTDGKSFQRLVQNITEKGPTVIVIKIKNSSRVIGAFCDSEWLTVAEREKQAVSNAAAKQRAKREGQNSVGLFKKPENQNNVFFGTEQCFLFCTASDGPAHAEPSGIVYRSHPFANSNFMYLFDTHPQDEKIGIGMGGQPGYFGWFIDRWLERGECKGLKCTTFQNPRLSEEESWEVETVEAYAVKPEMVSKLLAERESGGGDGGRKSVLHKNSDTEVDKMILELHGVHEFDRNERPDC